MDAVRASPSRNCHFRFVLDLALGPDRTGLAAPLTVCLVVVGRHVDRLQFLDVLFGNEPALTPPQLIYQRMLAGDPIEASQQAQTHLASASLEGSTTQSC